LICLQGSGPLPLGTHEHLRLLGSLAAMLRFLFAIAFIASGVSPALNYAVLLPPLPGISERHRCMVARQATYDIVETEGATGDRSLGLFIPSGLAMVSRAALAFLAALGLMLTPVEPVHARGLGVNALRKLSRAMAAPRTMAILNKVSRTAMVVNYAAHPPAKHTAKLEASVASAAASAVAPAQGQHQ